MFLSFYDYYSTYIAIIVPCIIFATIISGYMKLVIKKYESIDTTCGYTGYELANAILRSNDLNNVAVVKIDGVLTDNYTPTGGGVVSLSHSVYHGISVAAIGIAAHECGHAVQHKERYLPYLVRSAIVPVVNFASKISIPLILIGFVLSYYSYTYSLGDSLISIGIILYASSAVFLLVTLFVEINASNRAYRILSNSGFFTKEELRGVRQVLIAAGLTYFSALVVSLAHLLRMVIIFGRRRSK